VEENFLKRCVKGGVSHPGIVIDNNNKAVAWLV
jgi:hypothetical protein